MTTMNNCLGVYIHVPFCKKKCSYCDFYSVCDESLRDDYRKALCAHIKEFFAKEGRLCVDTVFFGGGTPSFWGADSVCEVLKTLKDAADIKDDAEITCEANPESADEVFYRKVKDAGVNRISLGLQSADDGILKTIGRLHDFSRAALSVEKCRKNCTDNISLDLIYGLPGQSIDGWQDTVEKTIALDPKHISVYALKLEPGTPLYLQNPVLPDDDEQADMYLLACKMLSKSGYEQYEISNFAKKGFHSIHNLKYWTLEPYVGFGPAAHSFYKSERFFYEPDIKKYISGDREPITERDEDIAPGSAREWIMLKMRTCAGVCQNELEERFPKGLERILRVFEKYAGTGHIKIKDGKYSFTPEGFLVSNEILTDVLNAAE